MKQEHGRPAAATSYAIRAPFTAAMPFCAFDPATAFTCLTISFRDCSGAPA